MPPQILYYFNILKVKYIKILNQFWYFNIFDFLILKWFWLSAVPNISNSRFAKVLKCKFYVFDVQLILEECRSKHFMFPMFCIFLCWLHIEHIWVFTCLYFPKNVWEVYVLEFCTKYMNGNYVLNIFGDLFPKDLLVWICSGDVLQQVSSRNIFSIYLYVHIFPNIFSMKHFGTYFKKGFGNTMTPVRCCKNPIDFLWSIVTRCLLEDVLLQIFGIFVYTPEICLGNIIADIRKNLLRNIWGDWPKLVLRNCFQRYLQYDQVRKMFGKHVPKNVFTVSLGERCIQFFG